MQLRACPALRQTATFVAGAHTDTALQHKAFTAAGHLLQRSQAAAHLYPQIGIAGEHFCTPSCSFITAPGTSKASFTALGDRSTFSSTSSCSEETEVTSLQEALAEVAPPYALHCIVKCLLNAKVQALAHQRTYCAFRRPEATTSFCRHPHDMAKPETRHQARQRGGQEHTSLPLTCRNSSAHPVYQRSASS